MARAFISYSSRDEAIVHQIAQDLRATGIQVWLDTWEILAGDSIVQRIQEGLEGADVVVVCLSKHAVGSGWVEKEWQSQIGREAEGRGVRIIPALIEPCDVPPLLRDKARANFTDDYETGLAALLRAIEGHSGRPAARTPPARPAPFEARLVVERVDGKPEACWHTPDEGQPFALRLPLAPADLDQLRWYLETYAFGRRLRNQRCPRIGPFRTVFEPSGAAFPHATQPRPSPKREQPGANRSARHDGARLKSPS